MTECNCTIDCTMTTQIADNHLVTNFIDDNTSVVMFKNKQEIELYLTIYTLVLSSFYSMNKLMIKEAPSKTKNHLFSSAVQNPHVQPKYKMLLLTIPVFHVHRNDYNQQVYEIKNHHQL